MYRTFPLISSVVSHKILTKGDNNMADDTELYAQGQDYLDNMLALDEGARRLGEFAFGNNRNVDRCTKDTLFDEKMGGTVHLALGASIPETGGVNQSALHVDMVCDLRSGSEIRVDGVLFCKDGQFVI